MTPRSPKTENDTSGSASPCLLGEGLCHRLVHRRMSSVDESAQIATLPPEDGVEAGIERRGDPTDRPDRDRVQSPAFDPDDDRS